VRERARERESECESSGLSAGSLVSALSQTVGALFESLLSERER